MRPSPLAKGGLRGVPAGLDEASGLDSPPQPPLCKGGSVDDPCLYNDRRTRSAFSGSFRERGEDRFRHAPTVRDCHRDFSRTRFKTRPASARSLRDEELIAVIERVFGDKKLGRGICGARKMWHLLCREGIAVARCTVERLMRRQGLRGVRRGKKFITTRPDDRALRPIDHVQRCFTADRPNQLWVVDFTYVPTWSGMAFTAFVTDVFARRIVGWRTMNRMPTQLPLVSQY